MGSERSVKKSFRCRMLIASHMRICAIKRSKNNGQKICIYQNLAVTLHPICDWNCGSKAKMVHKNIFDFFTKKFGS